MTCFSLGTDKAVFPLCSTQMPAAKTPASTPTQMPPEPVAASTPTEGTPAAPAATTAQPQEGMLD